MVEPVSGAPATLWLRFVGPDLGSRSVPVSELAESLKAIQSILTQAHLHSTGRQSQAFLRHALARRKIALQLADRRHESDAYGLLPLLDNPIAVGVVTRLVAEGLKALAVFSTGKIRGLIQALGGRKPGIGEAAVETIETGKLTVDPGGHERGEGRQEAAGEHWDGTSDAVFLASIYQPVMTLARRVNAYGGVNRLEIFSSDATLPVASFERDTARALKPLGGEVVLGPSEAVAGVVKTLFYERTMAIIDRQTASDLRLRMTTEQFDALREEERGLLLRFDGQPCFKLGAKTPRVREFVVTSWGRLR